MNNKPLELIEEIYHAHYSYLRNYLIGFTRSDEEADDGLKHGRILDFQQYQRGRKWFILS